MKNRLKVLFIDDNEIEEELSKISRTLKKQGKEIEHCFINVSCNKYKERVKDGSDRHLVARSIIDDINQQGLLDIDFDIIACDFNFADDYVNGYDLMCDLIAKAKQDRKRIRRARVLFYTGQVNSLKDTIIRDIRKFLNLKVDSVVDRTELTERIVRLSNIIWDEMDYESIFLKSLEPHKEKIFRNTYPQFIGKTISDIINEIEIESHHGREYLKSLVEHTVATMIELQGE